MRKNVTKFATEFKQFIARGNVIDLAVGVVVGTAFTAIVNSLVKDIIMPFVGWIIGGMDFSSFVLTLPTKGEGVEPTQIMYGNFVNQIINFLILSFVVFLFIKLLGAMKRKQAEEIEEAVEEKAEEEPTPSEEVLLLTEIRDLLRK